MTTKNETVADVLARMRTHKVNHGKNTSPTLINFADDIEAALSQGEPVAWEISDGKHWVPCTKKAYENHGGEHRHGRALYTHSAQPLAVPVESLGRDAVPGPDSPIMKWAESAIAAQAAKPAAPPAPVDDWMPIESAPKGRKVIAGYPNRLGNWRTIIACYYPAGTLKKEDDFGDIDDDGYLSDGWYEETETLEVVRQTEETPTHWMSLPAQPTTPSPTTKKDDDNAADGWRDIYSIPKDESRVELLAANGKTDVGNYYHIDNPSYTFMGHLNTDGGHGDYTPWRPLTTKSPKGADNGN